MISHDHEVIFVHVPKCAGQSIELMFLNSLGIEWKDRAKLLLRPKKRFEKGPARLAHLFAYEYTKYEYITREDFNKYFKFAIVRDPIDRIISEMNYQNIRKHTFFGGVSSIEEYVSKTLKKNPLSDLARHVEPQVSYLYDESRSTLLVDKIINLSSLKTELPIALSPILGKSFDTDIPHHNASKKIWRRDEISSHDINYLLDFYKDDYNMLEEFHLITKSS